MQVMAASKTLDDENVPVAKWFVPRAQRRDIRLYYAFARLADDIADSPRLSPGEKAAALDALETSFRAGQGHPTASALGHLFREKHIPEAIALDFLIAFRRDIAGQGIAGLRDLDDYSLHSAAPFGRFVLAIHGEALPNASSDRLCVALQILNHLQDIKRDRIDMGRIYLPRDVMDRFDVTQADLSAACSSPALRQAIDVVLDHADGALEQARSLPATITSRRLAAQAEAIIWLTRRLSRRLRVQDPMASHVRLGLLDYAIAFAVGFLRLLNPRRAIDIRSVD
jgi:squalene synthase HpnC